MINCEQTRKPSSTGFFKKGMTSAFLRLREKPKMLKQKPTKRAIVGKMPNFFFGASTFTFIVCVSAFFFLTVEISDKLITNAISHSLKKLSKSQNNASTLSFFAYISC